MSLTGKHIVSIDIFTRQELENLLTVAHRLLPVARREVRCEVLAGAISANLFFEASTRTRMSFHTAFARLGGKIVDTTGFTFSSISKGESLEDTARVVAGYADVIVMRHPEAGSVGKFAKRINIPVINAGDGIGEHPSQALLDYYTIDSEFSRLGKKIDGMTIAMVGDLKNGRTIHSLSKLLSLFNNLTFNFIAPQELQIPDEWLEFLKNRGHKVFVYNHIAEGLKNADVIYATRIQRERIEGGEQMAGYGEEFRINAQAIKTYALPEAIIMHPLPRDSREGAYDLATDLDNLPQLAIFRQTDNGMLIRMALFASVLGVEKDLENHCHKLNLYKPQKISDFDASFYSLKN